MSSAKSAKLEDQAATAALYVTKGKTGKSDKGSKYPLDEDGKLSSASAATSLKHAQPQDLPAYPVHGLQNLESSAGAAASLANANQKTVEFWKPGEIKEANRAANLAKDIKVEAIPTPKAGPAGSMAALSAHQEGAQVKIWKPSDTDAGHSAAGQAMRKKGLSPTAYAGTSAEEDRKALMAAKGAISGNRRRSGSTPTTPNSYPDSNNSARNALKAATTADRPGKKPQAVQATGSQPALNAAKIHNQAVTNLSREMYTSHPPVAPEVNEKNRQDTMHAAAVVMAKKMYTLQQKQAEEAAALRRAESQSAAGVVHDRPASSASSSGSVDAPKYTNLEEAAKRLAAERLAKLHDEHAAYRNYYGMEKAPSKRMSLRGRRRASSEADADGSDEERSRKIRTQMSMFNDNVNKIDNKKRQTDRASLLAAAQRNVRASMNAQDEKVFSETGKVSPAMMAEWEAKAKAKAEAESKVRMANHGMVHIGGGKFLDQSEVDAIAAAKVQPTLDDISGTAEKQRARDEELRQQNLERERIAAEKNEDDKERATRTKEEWKKFREEEKREEKARREEAKARRSEDKKQSQDEKRKTTFGKIKGIFHKDDSGEGNQLALDKLEGKAGDSQKPAPTGETELAEAQTPKSAPVEKDEGPKAMSTIESGTQDERPLSTIPAKSGSTADEIAQRVFAAPVIAGGSESDNEGDEAGYKAQPAAKSEEEQDEPSKVIEQPPVQEEQPKPSSKETAATEKPAPKEDMPENVGAVPPVAERIAPPAVAMQPTTETTVTGPSSTSPPSKDKDGSKVSTWLKSKLGRRSSKPAQPSSSTSDTIKPTISAPQDPKVFVGGANLGAPDTETPTSSSDQPRDSSMREVALAGKEAGPVDAPAATPASEHAEGTALASGALAGEEGKDDGDSTSISSLSSDEETRSRGRSSVRLADQIKQSGAIFGTTSATHDKPPPAPAAAAAESEPKDASKDGRASADDQFEEAREGLSPETLEPPNKSVLGSGVGEGRKSDSPIRDSKFVEQL